MKPRSIISAAIFSISASFATVSSLAPNPATAQTLAQSRSECVRRTMYDAMGNIRRGMTAEAAAFACQSANSSNAVSQCVRQTMYDAMGNIRSGMNAEAAAFACSNNRGVPGYVIILEP